MSLLFRRSRLRAAAGLVVRAVAVPRRGEAVPAGRRDDLPSARAAPRQLGPDWPRPDPLSTLSLRA